MCMISCGFFLLFILDQYLLIVSPLSSHFAWPCCCLFLNLLFSRCVILLSIHAFCRRVDSFVSRSLFSVVFRRSSSSCLTRCLILYRCSFAVIFALCLFFDLNSSQLRCGFSDPEHCRCRSLISFF